MVNAVVSLSLYNCGILSVKFDEEVHMLFECSLSAQREAVANSGVPYNGQHVMDFIIRKATSYDNKQIARTIAYSFREDFSGFSNDCDRVAKVFENAVVCERFIVAEQKGKIVGITGIADCAGRTQYPKLWDCQKQLGFFWGIIVYMAFRVELMKPLKLPKTTGFIDILGVLEEARGQGIAKAMLGMAVELNPQFSEFVLTVKDNNAPAIKAYETFGFVEYDRVPYRWAKQAGFEAKVWMKYIQQ